MSMALPESCAGATGNAPSTGAYASLRLESLQMSKAMAVVDRAPPVPQTAAPLSDGQLLLQAVMRAADELG